jgi:LTXXQ motif family protein
VKRMLLAGVIAITAAVATPVLAQPAETTETPQTQAAPANNQGQAGDAQGVGERGGNAQGGGEQGGAGQWNRGQMRWGMHGWPMMRHAMWRGGMMRGDPQERCVDRLARRAAHRAYVETKLDLTAQQQPLWDKLQSIAQAEQQKERQLCGQLKPRAESTVLDRMDRAQQFLSARLDALQSAKPAIQALYQALTPEQRAIMDHPFRR